MHITVNVTQDHIDRGKPLNPESCAIALALSENRHTGVTVTGAHIYLNDPETGARRKYYVREGLHCWISTFDHLRDRAKPITVLLEDEGYAGLPGV